MIRDLRIYAQAFEGTVKQYRDNTDLEVDAIVETDDGRWGAFEIKLGTGKIPEAVASLTKFRDRIDTTKSGAPAVLGVIVGSGYGYVRPEDNIHVIPIGALAP